MFNFVLLLILACHSFENETLKKKINSDFEIIILSTSG